MEKPLNKNSMSDLTRDTQPILVVCHKNDIVFAEALKLAAEAISRKYQNVPIDLVLIEDLKFRKQTLLQLLLLEFRDIFSIISSYLFADNSGYKAFYGNITVVQNKQELLTVIQNHSLAYILTSKYIIPPSVLADRTIFNIHCGLLPSYRGLFPTFWSYMEKNFPGVSLHKIDDQIDKGEVIASYQMNEYRSYFETLKVLYAAGVKLIDQTNLDKNLRERLPVSMRQYYKLPTIVEIVRYRISRALFR